jgi:hypothetical protein
MKIEKAQIKSLNNKEQNVFSNSGASSNTSESIFTTKEETVMGASYSDKNQKINSITQKKFIQEYTDGDLKASNTISVDVEQNENTDVKFSDKLNFSGNLTDFLSHNEGITFSIDEKGKNTSGFFGIPNEVFSTEQMLRGDFSPTIKIKGEEKLTYKPFAGIQLFTNISGEASYTEQGHKNSASIKNGVSYDVSLYNTKNNSINLKNSMDYQYLYTGEFKKPETFSDSTSVSSGINTALTFKSGKVFDTNVSGHAQFTIKDNEDKTLQRGFGLNTSIRPFSNLKFSFGGDYSVSQSLSEDDKNSQTTTYNAGVEVNKNAKVSGKYQQKHEQKGKKESDTESLSISADIDLNKNVTVSGKYQADLQDNSKNTFSLSAKLKY